MRAKQASIAVETPRLKFHSLPFFLFPIFRRIVAIVAFVACTATPNPAAADLPGTPNSAALSGSAVAPVTTAAGTKDSDQNADDLSPDLFNGWYTHQIHLKFPRSVAGVEPDLSLVYRRRETGSALGRAWNLSLPYIERDRSFGLDYSEDSYLFASPTGQQALVAMGGDVFRPKIEQDFRRIRMVLAQDGHTYWEVTEKNGLRSLFGETEVSRLDDPNNPNHIFRWMLDQVVDTNGNAILFNYWKDQGQIYLDSIEYSKHVPAAGRPQCYVKMWYERRPDQEQTYDLSFPISTNFRLKTIDIQAGGSRVRAYRLAYLQTADTSESLLHEFQEYGDDTILDPSGKILTGSSLPATTISWHDVPTTFGAERNSGPIDWGQPSGRTWTDVNGDGRADFCRFTGTANNIDSAVKCLTSEKNGFGAEYQSVADWGYPTGRAWVDVNGDGKEAFCRVVGGANHSSSVVACIPFTGTGFGPQFQSGVIDWGYESGRAWVDVNGDGRADYCRVVGVANPKTSSVGCLLSTGNGFGPQIQSGVIDWGQEQGRAWVDVNGDGKADYCRLVGNTNNVDSRVQCLLSTGTGFGTELVSPVVDWGYEQGRAWVDVNGDGLPDFCRVAGIPGAEVVKCLLSTGTGFGSEIQSRAIDWGHDQGRQWLDVNGDGKADYCRLVGNVNHTDSHVKCLLSTGTGFGPEIDSPVVDWGYDEGRSWADVNGDGRPDYCRVVGVASSQSVTCNIMKGFSSRLVANIDNGLGLSRSIDYSPSADFKHTILPFSFPIVTSITTIVSPHSPSVLPSTQTYSYSGGYYNLAERDFRGFNHAAVDGPSDAFGVRQIKDYWFHQGNNTAVDVNDPSGAFGFLKGKPYRIETRDEKRTLLRSQTIAYTDPIVPFVPFFAPPKEIVTSDCDGTACRSHRIRFNQYDSFGNAISEVDEGDVNEASNDRTTTRQFTNDVQDWIVGLPTIETLSQGGEIISSTELHYDGSVHCDSLDIAAPLTHGNLTHISRAIDSSARGEERLGYDAFGNPVCLLDPNGHMTRFTYDDTGTFLRSKTNALGQTIATNEYYGLGGGATDMGSWGLLKRTTDANKNSVSHQYDPFGRPTKLQMPDRSWITWSYHDYGKVTSQNILENRSDLSVVNSYLDGLSRVWMSRRKGPGKRTIAEETQYDAHGNVSERSNPYFEGKELPRFFKLKYDALNRITEVSRPDGTRSHNCYGPWTSNALDENGSRHRLSTDAFGQVVRVDEYETSFATCDTSEQTPYASTYYHYDARNLLTSIRDAAGRETLLKCDGLGRKIQIQDPNTGFRTFAYDLASNLLSERDSVGNSITSRYDPLNRIVAKAGSGPDGYGPIAYSYVYDAAVKNGIGHLAQMSDPTGSTKLTYDSLGRIYSEDRTLDGKHFVHVTNFDPLGRITRIQYPDHTTVGYEYDGLVLRRIREKGSLIAEWTDYDATLHPLHILFGNGVETSYTYSTSDNSNCPVDSGRLCTVKTKRGETLYQNLRYRYDPAGKLVDTFDAVNGRDTYIYDTLGRLKSDDHLGRQTTFRYDKLGNMAWKSDIGSYSYLAERSDLIARVGSKTFEHDADGNTVRSGDQHYSYSVDGKLLGVSGDPLHEVTFEYDANGVRVKRREREGVNAHVMLYVNRLYECSMQSFVGVINGAHDCVKLIYNGDTLIATDGKRPGSSLWLHTDPLGSMQVATNKAGSATALAQYSFYGSDRGAEGEENQVSLARRFIGQVLDSGTGLYYLNSRYYDPALGRFLTADGVTLNFLEPQTLNRYSYAQNDPVNFRDPSGYSPEGDGFGGNKESHDYGGLYSEKERADRDKEFHDMSDRVREMSDGMKGPRDFQSDMKRFEATPELKMPGFVASGQKDSQRDWHDAELLRQSADELVKGTVEELLKKIMGESFLLLKIAGDVQKIVNSGDDNEASNRVDDLINDVIGVVVGPEVLIFEATNAGGGPDEKKFDRRWEEQMSRPKGNRRLR